jgi:hypothetical protein
MHSLADKRGNGKRESGGIRLLTENGGSFRAYLLVGSTKAPPSIPPSVVHGFRILVRREF